MIESATWRLTPAATSAARRLRPEVSKKRIGEVNHHGRVDHGFFEPFTGDGVDAALGRGGNDLVAVLRRMATAGAADHDDLMLDPFLLDKSRSIPSRRWCSTPFLALKFRARFGALCVGPSCLTRCAHVQSRTRRDWLLRRVQD